MRPAISYCLIFISMFFAATITAQPKYSVSFSNATTKISRSKSEDIPVRVFLKTSIGSYKDSSRYKVVITVDPRTTFDQTAYHLDFVERPFSMISDTIVA
jgi:hypothetical protein